MNRYKAQGCQLYSEKPIGNRDGETVLKIPVVFHVVVPPTHSGDAYDYIAPDTIYDCLNILDMIFAGASPFDTVNINTNIKFYPATIDIYGDSLYVDYQCERYFGITYDFQNDLSEYEDININRNGHRVTYPYSWENASNCDNDYYNVFPQEKYLNIWIFDDVGGYNGMGGSVVWDGHSCGLVALPKKVIGTNAEVGHELGYGIAHEVGHYFGLTHPWPDYGVPFISIDDVLSHSGSLGDCDTIDVYHNNERVSCNNIMEYTPDGCRNGFSQGQKDHMRGVIDRWFSGLTNCENYIYQGSRLSMFSTEIVSPVENIICSSNTIATEIKVNLPDTAIFRGLKIYSDNTNDASFNRQDTVGRTSTSFTFNYTFEVEGRYELSVYCGRSDCEVQACSRTIMAVGCEALISGLEKAQWYFDKKVSLDLSSGLARLKYDSQMEAGSSESSICDNNGNVAFYTDGNKIWNCRHELLSQHLEDAANKGTIILKHTETEFSIVTLSVDRILKGRKITVDTNNDTTVSSLTTIYDTCSLYGLTAVPTTDGNYWLISTKKDGNTLIPFLIKVDGQLGVLRTVTNGTCPMSFGSNPEVSIKVSPDANFISYSINGISTNLFRFNAASGTIFPTNCHFNNDSKFPQVAFSPSGRYLYMAEENISNNELSISQYDLKDFNDCLCYIPRKKIFSKDASSPNEYCYTELFLQEGADGRIYISRHSDNPYKSRMLGVILYPDAETNSYLVDNNCGVYDHFIDYPSDSEMKNDINLPNFVDGAVDTCKVDFSVCADSCNARTLHFVNLSQGTVFSWTVKDMLGNTLYSGSNIESILPSLSNLPAFIVTLTGSCGSKTDTIAFNTDFSISGASIMCRDDRLYPYRILPDVPTQSIMWSYLSETVNGNNRSININSADVPKTQETFTITSIVTDRFACKDTARLNVTLYNMPYSISKTSYCNEMNPGTATFTINSPDAYPYDLIIEDVSNITNSSEHHHTFNNLQGTYNYTISNDVCSYSRHFTIDDELTGFNCTISPGCNIVKVNILNNSYQSLSGFTFDFIIGSSIIETISESNECMFEVNFYDSLANIYINPEGINQILPISIRIIDSNTHCEHIIDTIINVPPHIKIPYRPIKPIYCEGDTGYTCINIYGFSDAAMIGFSTGTDEFCRFQYVETEAEDYLTYQVNSTVENPTIIVLDRNYDNCIIFKDTIPIPKINFEAVDSVGVICEEGGTADIYVNITIDPFYNILPDSVHWNTNTATYLEQIGFNTYRTVLPNVHAGTYEYTIPYASGCTYENSITVEESPHVTIVDISTRYVEEDDGWWICPIYSTRMYFGYTLEIYNSEDSLLLQRQNIFLGMYMCYWSFPDGIYTAKLIDPCGGYTTYHFVLERNSLVLENVRLADVTCKTDYKTSATFDIYGSETPYTVQIISSGVTLASRTYNRAGTYTIYFTAPSSGGTINIEATSADNSPASQQVVLNMVCNQTALTANNLQSSYSGQTLVVANNPYGLIFTQNVTFSNCTIYCAYDTYDSIAETKWTVPEGKHIVLKGTTVKSGCTDKMWAGITVIGDSTKNHDMNNIEYHGSVLVRDTCFIEDAICAVNSYQGGITTVDSSCFNNNMYDIYIHSYRYPYTVGNTSLIIGNSFSTTRLLNDYTVFPEAHICMENVLGVVVKSNLFQNTLPFDYYYGITTINRPHITPVIPIVLNTYYTENRGIGIKSMLSSFTTNSVTEGTNTFSGLYYGIYANGQNQNSISLYSNKMTNNYRGIYLTANTGANVKYNTVSVSEGPFSFFNNYMYVGNNGIPQETVPYGIYLNECIDYSVQYDTITKGTTGMYVRNSGTGALQISNCVFGNSSTTGSINAIIISGTNSDYGSNNSGPIYNGLQIVCNDFTGNTNDIGVINGNMGSVQGFPNGTDYLPAGNQFNIAAPSTMEFRTQFQSNFWGNYTSFDFGPYSYYQHDDSYNNIQNGFERELETGRYTEVVLNGRGGVIPNTKENYGYVQSYCQSRNTTCAELISEINDYGDNLEKLEVDYATRLDGGGTQSLLADIRTNSSYANYDFDGFMSDECFYAILDEVENNPSYYVSILIENSPLPEHIYRIAMSKNIPEIYKNTLAQYQSGENTRVIADREMYALRQSISYNESMLMNNAMNNDSIPSERLMALAYFGDKTDLQSKINVYRINCASGNYSAALTNLSDIEVSSTADNYEISTFCELNRLYIGVITNSLNTSLDTSFLRNAVNEQNYLYSALAQVLYEYATDSITYHYTPLFIDEVQPRSLKADGDDNLPIFYVYPNPTDGIVNIEINANMDESMMSFCEKYGLPTIFDCEKISIEVFDVNSRLIMSEESSIQEPLQIDLSKYPPSNYTIKIKDCNDNLLLFKVVKI
ncbi:MAG: zinc-dependent metalloprotease [Bacteroidales bacterium]|nr:zinc-dependent metalloprotease [Bacteroidales bacterium]